MSKNEYQPKTGAKCGCRRGVQRDNCSNCEGTGWVIDFATIRNRNQPAKQDAGPTMFVPVLPDELERVKVPTRPIKTKRRPETGINNKLK